MVVEFGFALPAGPPKGKVALWLQNFDSFIPTIEKCFQSIWVTDHFFWEDAPTFEAWTWLTYLAARYPQFKIGPMVLGQGYRNPALLAKMGATLQTLSNGRLLFGIGAGWKEDEYRAYGYPYPTAATRLEQLRDTLEIINRLWSIDGQVSYQGKHYRIENAYCENKPQLIPPIIVGGGGKTTMKLAVQYADWWNLHDANPEVYRKKLTILNQHCALLNRAPETLRLTWFGRLGMAETENEALKMGKGRWTQENAIIGTKEQVRVVIDELIKLGVDYFIFSVLRFEEAEILGRVVENLLEYTDA
jgi:alkanesulfonate monooxygenase SsuD/methylene tetrahydromethanopterin reductase-like flavin-dependent oxidoreductase (luciferase family)